ncbi:hypothetical protein [Streptomyces sp. NPDC052107]|uniref:hypothetical protein n=1 Tax=Streptomyces sp. NPDC052107 TaxID=3155632 RepID=UPI0034121B56
MLTVNRVWWMRSNSQKYAVGGMLSLEQVAMPPHDRVRAYQHQELAQLLPRQMVEQASEGSAVGVGELGLVDLALQYEQLVP